MRMKMLLFFSILVGVYSLYTETKSDNSSFTDGTSTKVSRFLQEILNQESLVRFSTSQKIQQLMLDAADSKKNDDVLFEMLQNTTKELRLMKSENQKHKNENFNLKGQIHQIQENQSVGRTEFLSHEQEYQNFSLVVNEQFKNIRKNQAAGDIKLTEFTEQSNMLLNNLTGVTKKLEAKNRKQKKDVSRVNRVLQNVELRSDTFMKNLTSITTDMQKLETKTQRQNKEIAELRKELTNLNANISHLQSKQADGSNEISQLKENYVSFSSAVNETLKNIMHNQSANDEKLKEPTAKPNIRSCFLNPECYVQMSFIFDDSFNACHGDMYIKNSTYDFGKYVGIILCSPTRYHLFMSDHINGMFYNIADSNGTGEDQCELIGGSQQNANVSSEYTQSPITNGYWRPNMHTPFKFGKVGYNSKTGRWYGDWLECGVTIPDDIIVL